jgi:hypothetical protein
VGEVRPLSIRRALHRHDNPSVVTTLEIAETVIDIHQKCGMECATKVRAVQMVRDDRS